MYIILHTYLSTPEMTCMQTSRTRRASTRGKKTTPPSVSVLRPSQEDFRCWCETLEMQLVLRNLAARCYDRLFSARVTLWCMIRQRLNHENTLRSVVADVHHGGADHVGPRDKLPLSKRMHSLATAAFCQARQRIPLALFFAALDAQARGMRREMEDAARWHGWRTHILDGTHGSLRPFPNIRKHFPAAANQHGRAYWALMRVVVSCCARSGIVTAFATGSMHQSEQALAAQIIQSGGPDTLYLGDRNFGIYAVMRAVILAKSQALFRMTETRARKAAGAAFHARQFRDIPVNMHPSANDIRLASDPLPPCPGRLLVVLCHRPGFRSQWLYLLTTLTDENTYPAAELLSLYGQRWQVEVNLRTLKADMHLNHLNVQSADLAQKEWLAGLMAYNLVRGAMWAAARQHGQQALRLSFSDARCEILRMLAARCDPAEADALWDQLLYDLSKLRIASRRKRRPSEPRAKRHRRETFPPLRGSRAAAHRAIMKAHRNQRVKKERPANSRAKS